MKSSNRLSNLTCLFSKTKSKTTATLLGCYIWNSSLKTHGQLSLNVRRNRALYHLFPTWTHTSVLWGLMSNNKVVSNICKYIQLDYTLPVIAISLEISKIDDIFLSFWRYGEVNVLVRATQPTMLCMKTNTLYILNLKLSMHFVIERNM